MDTSLRLQCLPLPSSVGAVNFYFAWRLVMANASLWIFGALLWQPSPSWRDYNDRRSQIQ